MNRRLPISIFAFLLVLGLVAGCSDDSGDPLQTGLTGSDSYTDMDFSQAHGGLTATDEQVAFADEGLEAMMLAEDGEEHDDEFLHDEDIESWLEQGDRPGGPEDPDRPRFTFLRLAWGMVHSPGDTMIIPEEPCDILDWSGEIHTDRGIVLVRRVIRFEGDDHLVRPRLDRRTVAFGSHTACGFDGLLLQIIERPADRDSSNGLPNRLHINTGPYSGVYEVAELAGLGEVHEIDEAGNVFQLNGFTLSDINYCPKGFLSGRYRLLDDDRLDGAGVPGAQVGTLAGAYLDLTGRIRGFMRGGYGFDEAGDPVIFAKYIDREGRFRGLLQGTWTAGEGPNDLAEFMGHWTTGNGAREGVLGGLGHDVAGHRGGFYQGRWTTVCDEEAEGQVQ